MPPCKIASLAHLDEPRGRARECEGARIVAAQLGRLGVGRGDKADAVVVQHVDQVDEAAHGVAPSRAITGMPSIITV